MTSLKDGVGVSLLLLLSLLLLAGSKSYASQVGNEPVLIEQPPTLVAPTPEPASSVSQTSDNLINNNNWNGAAYGADPGGCCASISGSGALYDTTTDTIMFSYGQDILSQTIAINEALKLSGIEVDGYNYGWSWRTISNNGSGGDTLQFEVTVKDASGNEVERYVYDYSSSLHAMDVWHTESGTETFSQSYLDPQSIALKIIGKDGGFWAGYYGPEVKDVSLTLNYSANPCATNPLYDPSCDGYADAYAEQQYNLNCQANPLYDSGCPGYQQAYYDQQCNANPLYDVGCPNYSQAYYDQQCSINPLYDVSCPGYQQAYYDNQCSLDPLYDSGCTGYQQAYLDQQCGIDPLYDSTCSGYADAYYDLQCSIDSLYDSGCTGYAQAYYDQQCSINSLYDTGCPGYAQAYYDNQCSLNPLYDTGCTGYADAYFSQQCGLDPLYDTQCPGYATAYYNQQCGLDPLYDSGCIGYEEAYSAWQLDRVCNANSQADPRCPNYVAPSEAKSSETQISSASETINTVVDTEEIGKPSTTGDATVDSVLKDLADVPTTTVGMEVETVATIEVEPETQEASQETETSSEADTTGEVEELVAEIENGDGTESENVSESSGDVDEQDSEGDGDGESESSESDGAESGKDEKSKDSKREKMKKAVAKKAMALAENMSNAASLEAQQAVQQQVLALINYVPDFNTYNRMMNGGYLPDATGYPDSNVPESRRGLRNGLAQQLLHEKMIELQYERR